MRWHERELFILLLMMKKVMTDRKLRDESEPKAKLESEARSFSEISENEPKAKFELNEENFII